MPIPLLWKLMGMCFHVVFRFHCYSRLGGTRYPELLSVFRDRLEGVGVLSPQGVRTAVRPQLAAVSFEKSSGGSSSSHFWVIFPCSPVLVLSLWSRGSFVPCPSGPADTEG